MSQLLDRGPHTVTVYLEETVTDSYGNTVRRTSDVGVTVTGCLLTPMFADRDATSQTSSAAGQRGDRTWRFRARTAPLEPWGLVVWDDGTTVRRLTVLDGPLRFTYSAATAHVAATLHEEN